MVMILSKIYGVQRGGRSVLSLGVVSQFRAGLMITLRRKSSKTVLYRLVRPARWDTYNGGGFKLFGLTPWTNPHELPFCRARARIERLTMEYKADMRLGEACACHLCVCRKGGIVCGI